LESTAAGERARATAASGTERLAGAANEDGTVELRSPELRAADAGAQLRRALLDGALRAPRRPRADPHRRRLRASDPAIAGVRGGPGRPGAREAARDQVPSVRSPSGLPWRRQRPPRRSGKPLASTLDLRVRVWAVFGDFSRVRVSAVGFGGYFSGFRVLVLMIWAQNFMTEA